MQDAKTVQTPLGAHLKLSHEQSPQTEKEKFMSNPGKSHWMALKWIMRYLNGTKSVGIVFKRNQSYNNCIEGFADADYAGDMDRRKSTFGFVFTLWGNTVSSKSKLQHMVTLSSTESEYVVLTEVAKEATWLKGLVNELGIEQQTVKINSDS
ncbi:secreted RxLR effector protein 161-like [Pistacia vera]|uniref:secreted RxLR effector protein 161-like n=1 Tax=Pistacia vera TaxID=55513 RepID=UPI001263A4C0|nr:secreted RxLR effector protein 161-like [Pistacia vera]